MSLNVKIHGAVTCPKCGHVIPVGGMPGSSNKKNSPKLGLATKIDKKITSFKKKVEKTIAFIIKLAFIGLIIYGIYYWITNQKTTPALGQNIQNSPKMTKEQIMDIKHETAIAPEQWDEIQLQKETEMIQANTDVHHFPNKTEKGWHLEAQKKTGKYVKVYDVVQK